MENLKDLFIRIVYLDVVLMTMSYGSFTELRTIGVTKDFPPFVTNCAPRSDKIFVGGPQRPK